METAPPSNSESVDQEHLRLLTIFHYVLSGITALFACMPLIYVAMGAAFILAPENISQGSAGGLPPAWFGWFIVVMGVAFALMGWALAILTLISGRYIARREKRIFSMVVAGIQCTFMPFGTVLGIFTLIVLQRQSIRELYAMESMP